MTERLFIFGLGYSGLEIARLAKAAGWSVAGTCTSEQKAAGLRADGIEAHRFDGTAALPALVMDGASHVLCTIAPGTVGDPAPKPGRPRSLSRLAAERAWQALGLEAGVAVDVFRLPGIYGPGRSAVDQVKAGTARRIDKPGQVFSRIHVEDIAGTVLMAITGAHAGAVYNVADDLPASTSDVVAFACDLLGRPAPPVIPWEQVAPTMSAMARSFYAETRRVKNDRIKNELGVVLRYPTYREGLRAIAAAAVRPPAKAAAPRPSR